MFMDRKTILSSYQSNSSIDQPNPDQNFSKLFCGYQQTDSAIYVEKQKTQSNQHSIEGEQRGKIDTTQLQGLL